MSFFCGHVTTQFVNDCGLMDTLINEWIPGWINTWINASWIVSEKIDLRNEWIDE